MDTQTLITPTNMQGLLPILYTACCEEEFTPDELAQLGQQALAVTGLPAQARQMVSTWLCPSEPLLARDFVLMRKEIRELVSRHSALRPNCSLLDLAVALCEPPEASRELLAKVQELLGLVGANAPVELFPPGLPAAPPKTVERAPAATLNAFQEWLKIGIPAGQQRQRHKIEETLKHPRFRHEYGLSTSAYRERILGWCLELTSIGVGRLPFPKDCGGEDDLGAFLSTMETLALFDLSLVIKFGVNIGLFGGSVNLLGTAAHHQKYLPKAMTFEVPGCFAMTETGHGSNVRGLATTARYDRQTREFVIHTPNPAARKDYIGNAALHARWATVFAQLEIDDQGYGVHAFVVEIRDEHHYKMPGVDIEDCGEKIGLNGVDNGRLRFTQVRVPRENLLDRFAQVSPEGEYSSPISNPAKRFFTMIGTLVTGRVTIASAALSTSKVALSTALLYAAERRQFGEEGRAESTILDYQTHQYRLIPRLAATLALKVTVGKVFLMCEDSDEIVRRGLESLASGLKAWATWHAMDTIQTARECCGGQGYLAVNRFGQLKADMDVFTTFEGDNTVLMQQVSKALLTDYKHQFSDLRLLGFMRRFTAQAAASMMEWNPVVTRNSEPDHLRDGDFHLRAFKVRESHLLSSLARRLKDKAERGGNGWQAQIQCQVHMVRLGKAHVERILLENFLASLADCPKGGWDGLKRMVDIFALSVLENDRGWFLENGYFEGVKSKAIRNLLLDLCREAQEDSLTMVEAFALPDKALAAPIARGDYPIPPVI